jgi:hypothetical protein
MRDRKKRLQDEHDALAKKVDKLEEVLYSNPIALANASRVQHSLLKVQHQIMQSYLGVLALRLNDLG